jgi:hypothetical protein
LKDNLEDAGDENLRRGDFSGVPSGDSKDDRGDSKFR